MRKLLSLFTIIICFAILFYPDTTTGKLNGSPGGKTGSPTDNSDCTSCHNAGAGNGATITTNIPASGYVPGNVYTINTDITQSGINTFGFEITAEENNSNNKTGTFFVTNSTETKLANSNTAITHKQTGTSGTNSKSWSMDWEAPNSGTGDITFYASYIGANGNGNSNGDTYHSASLTFNEAILGCTDPIACNYDTAATADDGSCLTVYGCIDPAATNYDPSATCGTACTYCNKSLTQGLTGFDPNPVYALWDWSYDTLTLTNTSNCEIRVRPEFDIQHDNSPIAPTDFDLTWWNPFGLFWSPIPYSIDANGHAVGYWSIGGDTTGQLMNQGDDQQVMIRVRFKTGANYGTYCALWTTKEVDATGNVIQTLASGSSTCLSLVNCSNFAIDSSLTSDVTCFNANDGSSSILSIQNGSGNYLYAWDNGDTTNEINNLNPGNYHCIVTDINWQCSDSIGVSISEPNELTSSYTQTNVNCFGVNDGSAIVNFFGGTIGDTIGDTNYILGWAGTNLPFYLPYPQSVFNTNLLPAPYNAIPADIYPYTVTDLNGCIIYDTITITEPDSLFITYNTTEIACNGGNEGEIEIQVNGGTAPFDNYLNGILQNNLLTTNLGAGLYIDSIVDANGCATVNTIMLNEPDELISTLTTVNISCNSLCDGAIFSSNSGGITPYSLSWSNGATNNSIDSLCPGNYTLLVTDYNGCGESVSATISNPTAISLIIDSSSNITNYGWNDGSIYISSTGGSGQLTTSWTSDNGFASNNEDITNLLSGLYYLEITDNNSCAYLDTIELTQPSSLWMNLDLSTNASCFDSCDGTINITANGGDSTYTYTWTGPNGFISNNDDLTNLCNGAYIITVDDGTTTLTDTFNIYQPQEITSNLIVDSIVCVNGFAQAEINVWGGTQPLTYNWSNGGNNYITTVSSGAYSINVTDQNGCSINQSFSLTDPDSIISTISSTNINCFGGNDGSASISITNGGTAPYSYLWSNGQTTSIASGLSTGTYSCIITDANLCIDSASVNIIEPNEIISTTSSIDASCYDDCDGSISITATGGTPPYSYAWTNGQSTQTATGLCAGFYNVTITDANNCLVINSDIINEPNPLLINVWIDGTSLVATNGFATYQWYNGGGILIPGATSEIFNPTSMGEYYVVVTDGNCEENSYLINYNISGLNNLDNRIKIYPNPTNGLVIIEAANTINNITIMTCIGNELLNVENNNNKASSTKLDLSTFEKGIYIIQIEQNNQIANYRIVLQ